MASPEAVSSACVAASTAPITAAVGSIEANRGRASGNYAPPPVGDDAFCALRLAASAPAAKAKTTTGAASSAPRTSAAALAIAALSESRHPVHQKSDALVGELQAAASARASHRLVHRSPVHAAVNTVLCRANARLVEVEAPTASDVIDVAALLEMPDADPELIEAALRQVQQRDAHLATEIGTLQAAAVASVGDSLPDLSGISDELVGVSAGLDALELGLDGNSALIRRIGSELSSLRLAKTRAAETLALVDRLLQLDRAEAEAEAALAAADFEAAVSHAQQLAALLVEASDSVEAPTAARIGALGERVTAAVQAQLSDALAAADQPRVGRFCRLLGPLGRGGESEARYVQFCAQQLSTAAGAEAVAESEARAKVPQLLSKLLRRVAELLAAAADGFSADDGGGASHARLAAEMYAISISLGGKLMGRYNSALGLRAQVAAAKERMNRPVNTGSLPELDSEAEGEVLRSEALLDELAGLLRGAMQYDAYMVQQLAGSGAASSAHGHGGIGGACGVLGGSSAGGVGGGGETAAKSLRRTDAFSELARALSILSQQHAWAAVIRALRADAALERRTAERPEAAPKSAVAAVAGGSAGGVSEAGKSELVDSVFYVLQRALRRAAHSCDPAIGVAAVEHSTGLLNRRLLEHLQGQLKQSLSSKLAGAAAQAIAATADRTAAGGSLTGAAGLAVSAAGAARLPAVLRSLDALQLCLVCTPRLWQQARDEFAAALPPSAIESVGAQLAVAGNVEAAMQVTLDGGLQQLAAMLMPRLKAKLDAFTSRSYALGSEEELARAEGTSFVGPLLTELQATLDALRVSLSAENVEALLQVLVTSCAERVEQLLMHKRMDLYGALQFELEVRALGKRLAEMSTRSVRDKLARLTQIATLLNLEHEVEMLDVWEQGGLRLSAAEAKQVLGLRVEFKKETIAQLQLR